MQGPDRESAALIPTSVLVNVVEVADRAGLPTDRWLAAAGLSAATLSSPDTRVSFRQAATVLRHAVRAMPDRGLGIDVGARDMFVSFGVLGLAIRSAENLGTAMQVGLELHQSAGSLMDLGAELIGDTFALRAYERHPEPELLPFLCEELFCSVLITVRTVLETQQTPEYVQVSYPAPAYAQRYREFFGCPVLFNADANRLAFPTPLWSQRLPRADPATHAVAVAACRDMLAQDDQPTDVVRTVETMLRDSVRDPLSMAQIAKRLNITERTLRRRLSAGGQQFTTLRDKVRSERARYLVRETAMPIHAIATEVGFTDPREFRRAYIKWTGHAPSHDR